MSNGMLSLDTCPRDTAGLMSVPRGVRYRLAYQLGMFADDSQEQAFNGATDGQQCEALAAGLAQRDSQKGMSPQQMLPMEQPPQMPPQQQPPQFPMQQPGMTPPQQPMQPQYGQPTGMPVMGQPVMPPQMQQPQPPQQPVRQPPQMGMPPQMQPPTMPGMQQMQQPQVPVYAPQPPTQQAPQPPAQQPPRQPPGDAGQSAALPVMRTMSEALKKVAEVNEANQKWLQQLHEQGHMHTKLLEALLRLLIVRYAQEGLDVKLLTSLVSQMNDDDLTCVLGAVDGKGKG